MRKTEQTVFRPIFIIGFVTTALITLVINVLNIQRMKGDGISYLDLADSYLRFDLDAIANSSWSPLYPFILAISKAIFRPGQYYEFVLVQLVNFVILVAALAAFHRLFLIIARNATEATNLYSGYFISLGLFVHCSLSLNSSTGVTPDMLLFCILLLMVSFLLKYLETGNGIDALLVGILCGFGFLSKAILFMITPIILLGLFVPASHGRKWKHGILALVGFVVISAPFVIFLSLDKGKFTFSDIGWINYCIDVGTCENDKANYYVKADENSGLVIYNTEYRNATFPPWFDLSEPWANAKINFSLKAQALAIKKNLQHANSFLFNLSTIPCCLSVLLFLTLKFRRFVEVLKKMWILTLIGMLGGVYVFTHIEERYVAPFLFIFFLPTVITYLSVRFEGRERWMQWILLASAGLLFLAPLYSPAKDWRKMIEASSRTYHAAVAASQNGLESGNKVVVVGGGIDLYWAKLVGIKIVGEFADPDKFGNLTDIERNALMCKLKDHEVKAIVTSNMPNNQELDWKEIYTGKSYTIPVACNEPLPEN